MCSSMLFDNRAVFFLYKAPVLFSDGIAYKLLFVEECTLNG